jgi:anti-sigma B factor antagonist
MAETNFGVEVLSGSGTSCSVISVAGPLVLENLFKFQSAWRGTSEQKLIFDLAGVPYMDSSAIGSLVIAHVSCANNGRAMALAGVPDRVKQILSATQVAALFSFYPDVASAEAALDERSAHNAPTVS